MREEAALYIPSRTAKPRTKGITVITDFGPDIFGWMGIEGTKDFLEAAGPFVDCSKMQAASVLVLSESSQQWIREKVDLYRQYGVEVYVGGILYEIAILQRRIEEALEFVRNLGFGALELSENLVNLDPAMRNQLIRRARQEGLEVIYEYGRKYAANPLSLKQALDAIGEVLSEGVKRIVIERFEIDMLRDCPEILQELVGTIGMEHVLLEADSSKFPDYYVWLIDTFGPEVNIGNVAPGHVLRLEQFRRGLGIPVGYRFLSEGRETNPLG